MTKEEKNQTNEEKIQTSEEKKYFAFISYSHKDKDAAKKLQNFIQGYKIPAKLEDRPDLPKRIGRVFRDEDELAGDELTPQIEEALRQSRYLIVVCSPNSANSKYVNEEIEYFKSLGGETKILPYIIAGKATTDEDPDCCYAPALKENQEKYQIVGGDAQENGAEAASVKLIAGMLRLEFNTLYDRFRKAEKRKRKIVITVSATFVLLATLVSLIIFNQNKDLKESKSVILAENAMNRIEKGDYFGARRTALEAITLSYSPEAERALRQSWESNSGILEGHTWKVHSVCFSPDGRYLASGSEDKTVIIWDVKNGEKIKNLKGHSSWVTSVSWSPDGKYLASGSSYFPDGGRALEELFIWEVKSGEKLKTLCGNNYSVYSISWSPDSKYLASCTETYVVNIWDAKSGECIQTLGRHSHNVESVCWSPDGKSLAGGGRNWEVDESNGIVNIWDAKTGKVLQTLEGHSDDVESVCWSPDGKYLASGSGDETVIIWDAKSGAKLQTLEGHSDDVNSISWSPDGKYLASSSSEWNGDKYNGIVKLWDVNGGECIRTLTEDSWSVSSVCWSPDGKYLASGLGVGNVKLLDLYKKKKYSILDSMPVNIYSRDLSPDGKYLAKGSNDKTAIIYDAKSEKKLKILKGHTEMVDAISWSPDGKYIISGSRDGIVKLWDAKSGLCLQTFDGHNGEVDFVGFTSDGRKIIAETFEGVILQWDFPPLDELIEKTKKWAGK